LSCSGGGSSFAGQVVFLGAGEDAGAGEVLWLVSGALGRAGDAGFVAFGLALELEACSGARGALKERKRQVSSQKKKQVANDAKRETYPEATGLCLLGWGTPTFCLFGC
jgi:hypothetical protein